MRDMVSENYDWRPTQFRDTFDRSVNRVIVVNGEDVGFISSWREPDALRIGNIIIAPQHQRPFSAKSLGNAGSVGHSLVQQTVRLDLVPRLALIPTAGSLVNQYARKLERPSQEHLCVSEGIK